MSRASKNSRAKMAPMELTPRQAAAARRRVGGDLYERTWAARRRRQAALDAAIEAARGGVTERTQREILARLARARAAAALASVGAALEARDRPPVFR